MILLTPSFFIPGQSNVVIETPVLNILYGNGTLTNANLTLSFNSPGNTASNNITTAISTVGQESAKYYMEWTIDSMDSLDQTDIGIGICNSSVTSANLLGRDATTCGAWLPGDNNIYAGDAVVGTSGYTGITNGAILMMAVDITNHLIWYGLNGVWNYGNPSTNTSGVYYGEYVVSGVTFPFIQMYNTNADATANFGANGFLFTMPSGFLEWNNQTPPAGFSPVNLIGTQGAFFIAGNATVVTTSSTSNANVSAWSDSSNNGYVLTPGGSFTNAPIFDANGWYSNTEFGGPSYGYYYSNGAPPYKAGIEFNPTSMNYLTNTNFSFESNTCSVFIMAITIPGTYGHWMSMMANCGVSYATLGTTAGTVTLSNNNTFASATSAGQGYALGSVSANSGKFYYECTIPFTLGTTDPIYYDYLIGLGVVNSSYSNVANGGGGINDGSSLAFMAGDGNFYANGTTTTGAMDGITGTNVVTGVATDIGNGQIWYNVANTWYPHAPTAGNGFTITATGNLYPLVWLQTSTNASVNFGGSTYTYTPPAGFDSWATGAPIAPSFDPNPEYFLGNAQPIIIDNALTVVANSLTSSTNTGGVYSTTTVHTGTYYFEVTLNSADNANCIGVGFANGFWDGNTIGFSSEGNISGGVYLGNSGDFYTNRTSYSGSFPSISNGETLGVVLNIVNSTTQEVYYMMSNTWYPTNPSSGSGFTMNLTPGGPGIYVICQTAEDGTGSATFNFGQTAYTYDLSTFDYQNWPGSPATPNADYYNGVNGTSFAVMQPGSTGSFIIQANNIINGVGGSNISNPQPWPSNTDVAATPHIFGFIANGNYMSLYADSTDPITSAAFSCNIGSNPNQLNLLGSAANTEGAGAEMAWMLITNKVLTPQNLSDLFSWAQSYYKFIPVTGTANGQTTLDFGNQDSLIIQPFT